MKIIRLQAEGFKRLVAVDISPEGDLVAVGGNNAEGKSSVLDSIFAALGGAAAAPVKPVRTGEEYAIIRLDLGDLKVTRYFGADGADRLKVENAEGATFSTPQTMLDKLVGSIAFDPLAFARMPAKDQAAELRRLVPLSVSLDDLAAADRKDMADRRDVNRDAKALKARIDAIEVSGIVPPRPDRDAIVAAMASAGETNAGILNDQRTRERMAEQAREDEQRAGRMSEEAASLRRRADELDEQARDIRNAAAEVIDRITAMPPLPAPVDTADLAEQLAQADRDLALLGRIDERKRLESEFEDLRTKSDAFTKAMEDRAELRAKALAEAKMPVEGLSFADFDGDQLVTYNGEPFSQASGAQQLRVSMGIAMAANPKLRVMLIKDGSLLDDKGLAIVRELASAGDYQVWLETVGEREGVGIIMEGGKVKDAPEPERVEAPRRRKPKVEETPGVDAEPGPNDAVAVAIAEEAFDPVTGEVPRAAAPAPEPAPEPAALPPRRKPSAMREFTSKPLGGDLFGKGE